MSQDDWLALHNEMNGSYLYDSDSECDNDNKKIEVRKEKSFYEKFDISVLENKPLSPEKLETLSTCFVLEHTPIGLVLMRWQHETETQAGLFLYYSDKTATYRILETVAKSFVLKFDCKALFVDINDELEKTKACLEDIKKAVEEKAKEKDETDDGVFAKLKKKEKKEINEKDILIKENFLHFKHAGLIKEYEGFSLKKKEKQPKQLSFKDYKQFIKK
jgi:hypothetical protein